MTELQKLKNQIKAYRAKSPGRKRFPLEFWQKAAELAEHMSYTNLGRELEIDKGYLSKRIKELKTAGEETSHKFLQVPTMGLSQKKQITLELPHNITLRIEL